MSNGELRGMRIYIGSAPFFETARLAMPIEKTQREALSIIVKEIDGLIPKARASGNLSLAEKLENAKKYAEDQLAATSLPSTSNG